MSDGKIRIVIGVDFTAMGDLPRTPEPDTGDPDLDLHHERATATERLTLGRRPSRISGLV